jgi:hypothetical protein
MMLDVIKWFVYAMCIILIASFLKSVVYPYIRSKIWIFLLIIGISISCTEIVENVNTFNNLTVIEGDSINIGVDVDVNIIDSTSISIINNNDINIKIIDSVAQQATTKQCIEVPNTPIIVGIIPTTHDSPYIGSVVIGGLPTTMRWTLIRFPDKVITSGSGNSVTVYLDSRWTSQHGGKCYSTIYSWIVINVEIKSHE